MIEQTWAGPFVPARPPPTHKTWAFEHQEHRAYGDRIEIRRPCQRAAQGRSYTGKTGRRMAGPHAYSLHTGTQSHRPPPTHTHTDKCHAYALPIHALLHMTRTNGCTIEHNHEIHTHTRSLLHTHTSHTHGCFLSHVTRIFSKTHCTYAE